MNTARYQEQFQTTVDKHGCHPCFQSFVLYTEDKRGLKSTHQAVHPCDYLPRRWAFSQPSVYRANFSNAQEAAVYTSLALHEDSHSAYFYPRKGGAGPGDMHCEQLENQVHAFVPS